jgi:hypothetical protein
MKILNNFNSRKSRNKVNKLYSNINRNKKDTKIYNINNIKTKGELKNNK